MFFGILYFYYNLATLNAHKTLSGIEPNILSLIADYFNVDIVFETDMLDQLAYIDGRIGNGPVGKVRIWGKSLRLLGLKI